MRFLGDPDLSGPVPEVEVGWGWGPGLIWTQKERITYLYYVTWPITENGGTDAAPSTQSVGGNTYRLRNAHVNRGYGKVQGTYTAVYQYRGSWAWV